MCTVTIIPFGTGGLRLVTNRDENSARARGEPPRRVATLDGRAAVWPIDPQSGGTWVALNDDGLVLAILNSNPGMGAPLRGLVSRGLIIPRLVSASTSEEAAELLRAMDLGPFAPFRLVATDREGVGEFHWDGSRLVTEARGAAPRCFASSGLGDHLVRPRLALFEQWMAQHGAGANSQDGFHRHQWPDRPEISVMMERPDARTVSLTTVEWVPGVSGVMRYEAGPERQSVRLEAGSRAAAPVGPEAVS